MKGINSIGALLVYVPGYVDGWMNGCKSFFKDCLHQSKICFCTHLLFNYKCQRLVDKMFLNQIKVLLGNYQPKFL